MPAKHGSQTPNRTNHLPNIDIPQMADVSRGFVMYTESIA